MIVSYPLVNEDGSVTGCEVSFRLSGLHAIEHMNRWVRRPHQTLDEALATPRDNVDRYEMVPGSVTIHLARGEFNIQADYADLKAKMIALNEWDED